MPKIARWRRSGAVLAVLLAGALSACSSPSEVASDSGSGSGSSAPAASGATAQALQVAYEGQVGTPPTEPTTPEEGTKLWVVSCG
jgi:ribose transport system substrate-binding protein